MTQLVEVTGRPEYVAQKQYVVFFAFTLINIYSLTSLCYNSTMKLFSEDIGSVKTDEELAMLQKQFPHYDLGYICQSAAIQRRKTKAWMENLWTQYEAYADSHFLEEFKRHFIERAWELYLGATILSRNFGLNTHKDKGPDFACA